MPQGRSSTAYCYCRAIPAPAQTGCGQPCPTNYSSPASRWMPADTLSLSQTRLAAVAPASLLTGSGGISHIIVTTTWSTACTGWSQRGSRLRICASSSAVRWVAWHSFLWAEMYPDLMDGIVGLSCQPVEISGRNWIMRRAAAEAIRHDPGWNDGNYDKNPTHYIYSAAAGSFMPESAARIQEMAPTCAAADQLYDERVARIAKRDVNDSLWAIESIEDYSPEADLPKIKARVLLINTVEDVANPPELGTVERAMKKIRDGRYVLIPYSDQTHGHFTHYYAAVWKPYLTDFMGTLDPAAAAR